MSSLPDIQAVLQVPGRQLIAAPTVLVAEGLATTVVPAHAVAADANLVLLHVFDITFEGMLQCAGVTEVLLLGSVTRRVLCEGDTDVLVVVDKRRPQGTA